MMHAIGDYGSHIDNQAFAVFIAIVAAVAFGAWVGRMYERGVWSYPECAYCRASLTNPYCEPCADAEAARLTRLEQEGKR